MDISNPHQLPSKATLWNESGKDWTLMGHWKSYSINDWGFDTSEYDVFSLEFVLDKDPNSWTFNVIAKMKQKTMYNFVPYPGYNVIVVLFGRAGTIFTRGNEKKIIELKELTGIKMLI